MEITRASRGLSAIAQLLVSFTIRVRRSRGKMYIGHAAYVCLTLPHCIPTLLHGPGCNLEDGRVSSSCALLGGFAIGARVSLL